MSFLLPALRGSTAASASTARALSTSAVRLAGGSSKGSTAKKGNTPAKKQKQANFSKGKQGRAGGGSARIKAGGLTLKTSLAQEAAPLTDLVQLYPESIVPVNAGKGSVFPRNTYDQLQVFGLPTRLAEELAYGTPASVIRQDTIDLVKRLATAKGKSSEDSRFILHGGRGSGKSVLLIQAVAHALESGWIVLYEPEAQNWVNSTTQFAYDAENLCFSQPESAASLLTKLHAVNRDRLQSVKLPETIELSPKYKFDAGTKLDEIVALGAKDDRVAVKALEVTLDVLAKQTEFPVLFAIDDVQVLFRQSKYRQPDYSLLESYHLSTPRTALEYLTGKKNFARGAVIGASSLTATPFLPSKEFFAGLGLENCPESKYPITPYTKLDDVHVQNAASGIKTIHVPYGMSGTEAAAMFDIWTRKGWATNSSDEVFLGALQASQGNPKELARAWRLNHQSYIA